MFASGQKSAHHSEKVEKGYGNGLGNGPWSLEKYSVVAFRLMYQETYKVILTHQCLTSRFVLFVQGKVRVDSLFANYKFFREVAKSLRMIFLCFNLLEGANCFQTG